MFVQHLHLLAGILYSITQIIATPSGQMTLIAVYYCITYIFTANILQKKVRMDIVAVFSSSSHDLLTIPQCSCVRNE